MTAINFALVINIKARQGQANKLHDAAEVVAQAQSKHPNGRRYIVYRDFHHDQGQFKFVIPLLSIAELDHPPGETFKITREVLGQAGEIASKNFKEAIDTVRSDIIRLIPTVSNGRGGSKRKPSPYVRHTKVRTQPYFDCMGTGVKVLSALKKAKRNFATYKNFTGSEFEFHVVSRLESLGDLDNKPTLRSILRDVYGDEVGDELLLNHRKGIIDSSSSLLRYAPEISSY